MKKADVETWVDNPVTQELLQTILRAIDHAWELKKEYRPADDPLAYWKQGVRLEQTIQQYDGIAAALSDPDFYVETVNQYREEGKELELDE